MTDSKDLAQSLFLNALEIPTVGEREAYVDAHCGADPELRKEVEELLDHARRLGPFLESGEEEVDGTIAHSISERPGTIIGPYKLLQQVGEGGMGVVFMAEQAEPLRRTVALKIIKPGMDTRQVIARFEAERQALAMMDHPNIARVLDAGTTDTGRPYFVMDLVKGVPITEYCDQQQLPVRQRLELMSAVCHAVQHAHQKGIIHRDLKPSNVLVAEYDGRPVPKIIDFGVAKATASKLTEKTMFTELGQMVGTVEYMSPEQARFNQLDIDTRSDVYSLGVLVYELLTGSTPFGRKRLNEAAFDEMLRIIREEEPPRPSTRLSSSDALPSIAANRSLEPLKLNRLVQGELDWIVMKSLDKDRNRRYETATSFAADIERYLNDEAVQACPPSAAYCFQKFARRNKAPVMAVAVVLLTLVAGIVGTTLGLVRAEQARRAETERAEGERQAKQEAQAVLDFVEEKIFAVARPEGQDGGLGYDVTLRRAIEAALPFVDEKFADRPLIEARLRNTLGASFRYLGEASIAAEQFSKVRALYAQHLGPDHPETFKSMSNLANCYGDLLRHGEALQLREETLALQKAKLGLDHRDTLKSMNNLAVSYLHLGRSDEAIKLLEETLALQKARLGPDHPDTLMSMVNVANSYNTLERHAEALKLDEEALALLKAKLGPDHPDTLGCMNNLAVSYARLGRHAEALALRIETFELHKVKLGPDHPETLRSMYNLARGHFDLNRHAEALKIYNEILALRMAKFGTDHIYTLSTMQNVADSYEALGRHAEALKLREKALALQKTKLGLDHPDTLAGMNSLVNSYEVLGRNAEALKLREEKLALQTTNLGIDHPETLISMDNLANRYDVLERHAEALRVFGDAIRQRPDNAKLYHARGHFHFQAGRLREAIADFDKSLELDPNDNELWYHAAALYLYAGDVERYRGACLELLERFEKIAAEKPEIADRAAKTCALAPDSVADFSRVETLAQRCIADTENHRLHRWFILAKGLTDYRGGRHQETIEWLERFAPIADGTHSDATAFAALAMAHHRLDHADQARVSLDTALAIIAKKPEDWMRSSYWFDWLHCEILCREAEGLIGAASPPEVAEPVETQKKP